MEVTFRQAVIKDIKAICHFTDFWLAGRGCREDAPGAVDDCFISPSQHRKYINRYKTYLCFFNDMLIGWAVVQLDGSMIHFLISGNWRNRKIGSKFLKHIKPHSIRSKSDQGAGDPGPFYEKNGYRKTMTVRSKSRFDIDKIRPVREKNIDIYQRAC